MKQQLTINKWDREGVFVLVAEGRKQGPIVLETEGEDTSFAAAEKRMESVPWQLRSCICRLVPVAGNELLPLDMQRMQKDDEEKEDTPF